MADTRSLGPAADFPDGELVPVEVAGHRLVVARDGETVCVATDHCPHLGFPLSRGPGGRHYEDGVVQCPWHNSRFELCSGRNLDWASGFAGRPVPRWSRRLVSLGRAPKPLTVLPARVEAGQVLVELPHAPAAGSGSAG
jgi:nitrite reductase/ring-hydroxylating ferredoxin subunit